MPAVRSTIIPGPIPVPTHVLNVVYWNRLPASTIAPWVSYDYPVSDAEAQAELALGIHTVLYVNPLMPLGPGGSDYGYGYLHGAYADVIGKDCSGNVIPFPSDGYVGVIADYRAPRAFDYLQTLVSYVAGAHPHDDTVFFDNFAVDQVKTKLCGFVSYASDGAAIGRLASSLVMPFAQSFINSAWPASYEVTPAGLTNATQLAAVGSLTGTTFEGCLAGNPVQTKVDALGPWQSDENSLIAALAAGKMSQCMMNQKWSDQWAANAIAGREFLYASWLLTYDAWDSILDEVYYTTSKMNVYPEMGFVALGPTSTASTVTGYVDASGVYARSFAACYYRGAPLGPCIVAVNPTTSTLPFAYAAQYPNAWALSGSDVFDADAWICFCSTTPSSIAPSTGIVALQSPATPMGATPPPVITPTPSPVPSATPTP